MFRIKTVFLEIVPQDTKNAVLTEIISIDKVLFPQVWKKRKEYSFQKN